MSDRAPGNGLLGLLSDKAAYDTVRYLAAAPAGATQTQIITAVGTPVPGILRSLALEGFITRDGTWDLAADDRAIFTLTPRGQELHGHMQRLDEWARRRDSRNGHQAR